MPIDTYYSDSAYDLGADPVFQNIPDNASSATITFMLDATSFGGLSDESWAIDNLTVSATPIRELIAPNAIITDDNNTLTSMTVTLTNNPDGAYEKLLLNGAALTAAQGLIVTSTGSEITIEGPAPIATYQSILQGVQYSNIDQNPDGADRIITVVVNDGQDNSSVHTSTISVMPVNDAPVNSIPDAQSTNIGIAKVFSTGTGDAIQVSDVDNANVTVTLSVTNGALSLNGTTDLTFTTGNGTADATMTFSGTQAAINTALNGLSYAPTTNFNGSASLQIATSDGLLNDTDIVPITVNAAVNTVPGAQSTNEDVARGFSTVTGDAIQVSDVDNANVTVTLSVTNGALSLNGTTDLTFTTGNGTADATMTFSGTQAAINTALNGLSYTPTANFNGSASLQIATSDGTLSDTDTVAITVNAVNDAPMNTVPGAQSTNVGLAKVFSTANGNAIQVSDVDNTHVAVTLSVTNGASSLNGTTGLSFTIGDGTADATMTFSGTQVAIDTALNGLSYTPAANFNGASLQIVTSDGTLSDTDTVAITVIADPIILDLGPEGIDLSHAAAFDMNGDGRLDKIAWPGGQDGLLVMDLDGSGAIENGKEVFSP